MDPETKHVETVETVTADTAALAANSAERAQAAAQDAIVNAEKVVAAVTEQAAVEVQETQAGLETWQSSIEQRHEKLVLEAQRHAQGTQAKLAEAMEAITSIRSRLETPPENRKSPESAAPGDPPAEETPPAAKEPEAPRRKAHRWI